MSKRKSAIALTVQARDTYNEADYILVHNKYFDGMRDAIRQAHAQNGTGTCICIYCRHGDRAGLQANEDRT